MKKRIAVLFGGQSPEHDVSIVTGLQMLHALDPAKYEPFAVYIDGQGVWRVGEALKNRASYLPRAELRKKLRAVTPDLSARGFGRLLPVHGGAFAPKPVEFDVALLAFHGLKGEDGAMQGALQMAGVPYTGPRVLDAALAMDKAMAKRVAREAQVPVLRDIHIRRGEGFESAAALAELLSSRNLPFPVIVKPNRLGSSIGVAPAKSAEEAAQILQLIFRLDDSAILEPYLQNFTEYNVAVMRRGKNFVTSAIERPKRSEELLSFKQKYQSGGGKTGNKLGGAKQNLPSQGMLGMTREIAPALPPALEQSIRGYAAKLGAALNCAGAPRLDFLYDNDRGELYFNEINPIPGSFGYFLWEAAPEPMWLDDLLDHLIDEAERLRSAATLPDDPVPEDARLFAR